MSLNCSRRSGAHSSSCAGPGRPKLWLEDAGIWLARLRVGWRNIERAPQTHTDEPARSRSRCQGGTIQSSGARAVLLAARPNPERLQELAAPAFVFCHFMGSNKVATPVKRAKT